MAWAIRTIYTSKCVQMDPQQLPETSKFYSIFNKRDMQKTAGGGSTEQFRLSHLIIHLLHLNDTHLNRYSVPFWYSGNRTLASLDPPFGKPLFDSSQRS